MKKALCTIILVLLALAGVFAQHGLNYSEMWPSEVILAPDNPEEWNDFNKQLKRWKKKTRRTLQYDDGLYDAPAFRWAASAYNCYFLMMYDEEFFDYRRGIYNVDGFVDRIVADYGHVDIVVLWHAYPRIGLDERNQFDFYREMPGGLDAVRDICDRLHERDIKAFINYNPWDTGTRRENCTDIEVLVQIVKTIGADGIFLDTLPFGASGFREQLDMAGGGIVLESELALPVEGIHDHHLSWAQWFRDSEVPGVLRNKWFEQRHVQHTISRWSRDKSGDIQLAWMNGSGIMIWENVFGQYLNWSKRDRSMVRSVARIKEYCTDIFSSGEWVPFAGTIVGSKIYANQWSKKGMRLWTVVNRSGSHWEGEIIEIDKKRNQRYFDLVRGVEVIPMKAVGGRNVISGELTPEGLGCFIAMDKHLVDEAFMAFLNAQAGIYAQRSDDSTFRILPVQKSYYDKTTKYENIPAGMVEIPMVNTIQQTTFRAREVGYYESMDSTFIEAVYPALHHLITCSKHISLARFAIDETPVTNREFKRFLDESGYSPTTKDAFLQHWKNGEIPEGEEDHPVVYVDLNDARAYAMWAGKRLPTEEEWQFAAQGALQMKYPWGDEFDPAKCNSDTGSTSSVYDFPEGRSPFGCYDMCGNVWELTESECSDGHTRFCILKGGCHYRAQGSEWYFSGAAKSSDFAAKQILMYPGLDRCQTIGFRCVADLKQDQNH